MPLNLTHKHAELFRAHLTKDNYWTLRDAKNILQDLRKFLDENQLKIVKADPPEQPFHPTFVDTGEIT